MPVPKYSYDANPLPESSPEWPSYTPDGLRNNWDAPTSCYNNNARTLRKPRSRMKRCMTASAVLPFHWLWLGDSTLVGYNGSTYQHEFSIPRQAGKALAKFLGVEHTNGLMTAVPTVQAISDNVKLTGSWTTSGSAYPHFFTGLGAGSYTITFPDPGTAVEFYFSNQSGTGLTYSLDGATGVALSPTGAASLQKVVAGTGLKKMNHTLTFTGATSGQYFFLMALRSYDPLVPQIQTHNLAIGGSKANDPSNPNYNWSDNTTTASGGGLGWVMNQVMSLAGIAPDLLTICAGNNDHNSSIATANIIAGQATMRNYYSAAQAMLIRPPRVSGTNATTFVDLCTQSMAQADTLDTLFFDWNDYDQGQTNYAADGLAGADGNHPINGEQIAIGRAIVACLYAPMAAPDPQSRVLAALTSDVVSASLANLETTLLQAVIPVNSPYFLAPGRPIKIRLAGYSTSTGTLTFKVRVGTTGVAANDTIAWTSTTSAAQVANQRATVDVEAIFRAVGASGSMIAEGDGTAHTAALATAVAAPAAAAVDTRGQFYIEVTVQCTVASGFTARTGSIIVQ